MKKQIIASEAPIKTAARIQIVETPPEPPPVDDEVKPDDKQIMTLGEFQIAFVAIGEIFNKIRHLFLHEDTAVKEQATELVNSLFVYIKENKEFGLYCTRPLHERIEFNKLINDETFILPQPPDESNLDKTAIDFTTLINWSSRCFQISKASLYFNGQGNKKLASRIMSETKIALFNDRKTAGVLIKVELPEPELIKLNTMIEGIVKDEQLARLQAFRKKAAAVKENVPMPTPEEPAPEAAPQSRIIID